MTHKLSELQKKLLPLLEWFHNYCQENNLCYYILGGTMLGAARHQGFIPWDDDIDVGMPRKDYENFLKLTKEKQFGNIIVESIDTDKKDFYYGYAKIYDTSTTLVENTRYQIKRGIYIDLFPLDGVCNKSIDIKKIFKPIQHKYQLLLARTCAIRKNRKWYKNMAIYIARLMPINNKKLMLRIDQMCKQNDYENSTYIANFYGNWGIREIVEKKVLGKPQKYKFENLEVFGVENYDAYLTSLYGTWTKLPPKEKQVTHHDYVMCNLNSSYKDEK